jgi:hypothetical protein
MWLLHFIKFPSVVVTCQRTGRKILAPTADYDQYIGFEVLTAVVIKSSILWDIMPCSPLKVNRRFECCLLHIFFLRGLNPFYASVLCSATHDGKMPSVL